MEVGAPGTNTLSTRWLRSPVEFKSNWLENSDLRCLGAKKIPTKLSIEITCETLYDIMVTDPQLYQRLWELTSMKLNQNFLSFTIK